LGFLAGEIEMSEPTGLQEKMLALAAQRDYFEQAKAYAYAYLDGIFERNVYPDETALKNLQFFNEALPENPGLPSEMLRMLYEYGSPATVATTGGRYFGLVVGGVFPHLRREPRRHAVHAGANCGGVEKSTAVRGMLVRGQ
jgi:hypothetical protein